MSNLDAHDCLLGNARSHIKIAAQSVAAVAGGESGMSATEESGYARRVEETLVEALRDLDVPGRDALDAAFDDEDGRFDRERDRKAGLA